MSLINPEPAAIDRYLWDYAQDSIKALLEVISTGQAAINPDYKFFVERNLYRPTIEDLTENNHLVNILVGQVVTDGLQGDFSKNHLVTYNVDCYVQGFNEDDAGNLVPADQAAVDRLTYLCAMVEFGLTKLANYYLKDDRFIDKIHPEALDLTFNPVDDASDAATPYAPARFAYVIKFPYEPQDLENLPLLEAAKATFQNFASQIFNTP